jgi:hypothetical protein
MLWDRGYWEPEGNKSPENALACCGGRKIIIETFERDNRTQAPPSAASTTRPQTP